MRPDRRGHRVCAGSRSRVGKTGSGALSGPAGGARRYWAPSRASAIARKIGCRERGRRLERPMNYCDLAALERTPLERDPFEYVVVPDFLRSDRFPEVLSDYPEVPGPGSHPPAELSIRGHFEALIE